MKVPNNPEVASPAASFLWALRTRFELTARRHRCPGGQAPHRETPRAERGVSWRRKNFFDPLNAWRKRQESPGHQLGLYMYMGARDWFGQSRPAGATGDEVRRAR
jgi:hypothetical protein